MYPFGNQLENYFQTHGLVNLSGIEEIIKLPRDVWYRDAGAVSSLATSIAKTQLIVQGMIETNRTRFQRVMDWPMDAFLTMVAKDNFQQKNPNSDDLIAYCSEFKIPNLQTRAFELATKQVADESTGIFSSGYASGKFLQAIGKEKVLFDALEKENIGCPTPYRSARVPKYEGADFSDAAGLFALLKATRSGIADVQIPTFKNRSPIKPDQVKAFGL